MSERDYHALLCSVASSVLRKLDECNAEQFGGNSEEMQMLKGLLTHLPSIISSRPQSLFAISKSVFVLLEKMNSSSSLSSSSSWSDLVYPLAKLQDDLTATSKHRQHRLNLNDAALGSRSSSFTAHKKFPHFILNMETNIHFSKGCYTWIPLTAMIRMRMRVLLQQGRQTIFWRRLIFPSDFEFEKDKYVQLWVARGLPGDILFRDRLAKGYILNSRTDKSTGRIWYRINDKMVFPAVLDRVKGQPAFRLWACDLIRSEALVMMDDQIHLKAWINQIAQQFVTSLEGGGFFGCGTGCNFNIGSGTQTSGDVNIHTEVVEQQNVHLNLYIESKYSLRNKIKAIIVPLSLITFFAMIVICGMIKRQNWLQYQLGPICMKQHRVHMIAPT